MSAKPDGSGLVSNHVGHRSAHLPTVDECDEDWPPDTPLHDDRDDDDDDDVTALENPLPPPPPDAGEPRDGAPDVEGEDDIDEPMAVSSSEVTLTDTETKEALPDGPTAVMQPTDVRTRVLTVSFRYRRQGGYVLTLFVCLFVCLL